MKFELKKIDDSNFSCIPELFEDDEFFFKTKRPESLYEGNIKNILLECGEESFSILVEGRLEGLFFIEKDFTDEKSAFISIRLKNMDLLFNNVEILKDELYKHLEKYNILKMFIYDFDEAGKKAADLMKFTVEAKLKEHVFKNGSYHDCIIYSKEIGRGDI